MFGEPRFVMTYKDRFFARYGETHLAPRKGAPTPERLRDLAVAWRQLFGRFLPTDPNARILDAGCGSGAIVWWLHDRGFREAEGIDISAEQIREGRDLGVGNLMQADLETYLADRVEAYDTILARDVLEHFSKDSIVRLLDLMHRALRTGGTLILQVPNGESPFGGRIRYGDFTHETAFTSASMSQLLRVAGFSAVAIYPVEPVVRGMRSFARYVAWNVAQAMYRALLTAEVGRGRHVVTQNLLAVARK